MAGPSRAELERLLNEDRERSTRLERRLERQDGKIDELIKQQGALQQEMKYLLRKLSCRRADQQSRQAAARRRRPSQTVTVGTQISRCWKSYSLTDQLNSQWRAQLRQEHGQFVLRQFRCVIVHVCSRRLRW